MNAIDPSVMADPVTGKWWMHYGSFFGGLYCVELDPETGLPAEREIRGISPHAAPIIRKIIWKLPRLFTI